METILWRRLDSPGHDACALRASGDGWQIEGTAVFLEGGVPARLAYTVSCDPGFRTLRGEVSGLLGTRALRLRIERSSEGAWSLDGSTVPGLRDCVDLDLGFTPATNLLQIRRAALAPGGSAEVPAAWLDAGSATLERLEQRYSRRDESTYWYEAPRFGYEGLLEVSSSGFVLRYPGLWEAETVAARR